MPREKQEWSPLPSQRLDAGTRGKFGLGGRRKSHVRTMDQKGRHKSRTHSPLLAAHRRVEMDGVAVDRPGSTLLLTSKLKAGHKTNRPRAICSSLLRRCHPTNHNRGRAGQFWAFGPTPSSRMVGGQLKVCTPIGKSRTYPTPEFPRGRQPLMFGYLKKDAVNRCYPSLDFNLNCLRQDSGDQCTSSERPFKSTPRQSACFPRAVVAA